MIPRLFNGCRGKHRRGKGTFAGSSPAGDKHHTACVQQGIWEKMVCSHHVFIVGFYARNCVEHLGPDPELGQTCVRVLIDRYRGACAVGSSGLPALAAVYVVDG